MTTSAVSEVSSRHDSDHLLRSTDKASKGITSKTCDGLKQRFLKTTPEDVFAVSPKIRWAGLATSKGKVIFSQMRRGVKSLTPEEDDRALLKLRAQFLTEMCGPVMIWAGPVSYIAICYEQFTEFIVILKDKYVAMTLEKGTPAEAFKEIAASVQAKE